MMLHSVHRNTNSWLITTKLMKESNIGIAVEICEETPELLDAFTLKTRVPILQLALIFDFLALIPSTPKKPRASC